MAGFGLVFAASRGVPTIPVERSPQAAQLVRGGQARRLLAQLFFERGGQRRHFTRPDHQRGTLYAVCPVGHGGRIAQRSGGLDFQQVGLGAAYKECPQWLLRGPGISA
jgi:hypothetical protein